MPHGHIHIICYPAKGGQPGYKFVKQANPTGGSVLISRKTHKQVRVQHLKDKDFHVAVSMQQAAPALLRKASLCNVQCTQELCETL